MSCIFHSRLVFILRTNCNMKVKIYWWFFVVVLLVANFTLIESFKGWYRSLHNRSPYVRRRLYRPRSTPRKYFAREKIEAKNQKAWVETPPPPHRSMQYEKRLNYLAANKNGGKSNIGRILSGI